MTLAIGPIYSNRTDETEFNKVAEDASLRLLPPLSLDRIFDLYKAKPAQLLKVTLFLTQYPGLIPILLDACPVIASVFGEVDAYLEVEQDPEEDFRELFCVVLVRASPEVALQLLSDFDEIWFLEASKSAHNLLCFTVDTF